MSDPSAVNVSRACDNLATLGEQVPFALRLQSNLLLGITRVYALQARYFFQEVTSASTQMQKSTMTTFASNTLKVGATAPSHALVLAEDPNFHLHFNALDVLGDFIISHDPDSGYSDLSVTSSPRKARAERRNTPLGVVREVDYTVEWDRGVSPHHQFQEGGDQIEDVGFEFDPDGRMYDTDTNAPSDFTGLGGAMSGGVSVSEMSVLSPKRIGSFPPLPVGEAALPDEFQLELPQQEDEMANFQNGKFVVISEFNSFFAGFTQRYANTTHDCDCEPFIERDEREQPPVQKKTRTYYPAADERTDVRNADLRDWQYNYLNEMARVLQLDTLNARKRKQDVSVIESLFTLGNRPLGPDLHMFTGSALLGSNGIASQPATATQPSNTAPEESRQSSPRTPTAARSPPVPYSAEVGRDAPYTGLVDISGMGVGALGQDTPWSGLRSGTPSIGGPGSAAFGGFSSIAGSVLGSRRGSRAGSVLSASRRAKWPGMGDVSGGLMEGVEHEQDSKHFHCSYIETIRLTSYHLQHSVMMNICST